jgi:sugar phosphate isomerase/epimerase
MDPSHLICQLIDPVQTIHRFGSRIFHVHAKDAYIDPALMERYGICHPGVSERCASLAPRLSPKPLAANVIVFLFMTAKAR